MDPLRAALAKYVCVYKMIFFLHTDYNEYTLFCYHFHHHPPSPQKCSELLSYIFSCSHLNWYLACHSPKCSSKNITLSKSATNFKREINNILQVDNFFLHVIAFQYCFNFVNHSVCIIHNCQNMLSTKCHILQEDTYLCTAVDLHKKKDYIGRVFYSR